MKIRLGTRGSQLALWQAHTVQRLLQQSGHDVEIVIVKTTGDRRTDVPLSAIGGKGLFIKELEEALAAEEIDIAVHSLKDVPSLLPETFTLAAYLERGDVRDVLLHSSARNIDELPRDARVGTSSPRRRAQLLARRRDLVVESVRGNVPTRAAKIESGEFDAVILAAAGLRRLEMPLRDEQCLDIGIMVPAAGQGIVTIETVASRGDVIDALRGVDDPSSRRAAELERGVLQRFGTRLDCYSCIAVHARETNGGMHVDAFVSDFEATRPVRVSAEGRDVEALRDLVYDELVARGANELLESGESR